MKLSDYFAKKVVIQDVNGVVWYGFVEYFTSALDDEDGKETITVRVNNKLIDFYESDIRSIRVDEKKKQ